LSGERLVGLERHRAKLTRRAGLAGIVGVCVSAPAHAAEFDFDRFLDRFFPSQQSQLRDPMGPAWAIVAPPDISSPPYTCIGSCGLWRGETRVAHLGTAWLAGDGVAMTAAHVIALAELNWRQAVERGGADDLQLKIKFPALTAGAPREQLWSLAAREQMHPRYFANQDSKYDVARIQTNVDGALSIAAESAQTSWPQIKAPGYPWGSWQGQLYVGDTLCEDACSADRSADGKFVTYKADTEYGHSGAPVIVTDGHAHRVIAVHIGSSNTNRGVYINAEILAFIRG